MLGKCHNRWLCLQLIGLYTVLLEFNMVEVELKCNHNQLKNVLLEEHQIKESPSPQLYEAFLKITKQKNALQKRDLYQAR